MPKGVGYKEKKRKVRAKGTKRLGELTIDKLRKGTTNAIRNRRKMLDNI